MLSATVTGKERRRTRLRHPRPFYCLALATVLAMPGVGQPARLATDARGAPPILEVFAGGQRLGFLPDRAYVAAGGHALTVEFRGTPGVMPKRLSQADGALARGSIRVYYEDLWPGISLTYVTNPRGITESTYSVAAGADVGSIRLHYNVPVSLQRNGTLRFKFSTGYFTESSPEAWQEINGKRVTVKAAFKESNGEVGFQLDRYRSEFPLTIDPAIQWDGSRSKIEYEPQ